MPASVRTPRHRSVLITSCADGLGLEIAAAVAAAGHRVFAGVEDVSRTAELRARLTAIGARPTVLALDGHDEASVERAVAKVRQATGDRLDAVVVVPGPTTLGFFEDLSREAVHHSLEGVLLGAMEVVRAALPGMRRRREGRVVLISSHAALAPSPTLSALAAATWALEGWAEALALEVAPFGVGVTVLQPSLEASLATTTQPTSAAYRTLADRAEPRIRGADRHRASSSHEVARAAVAAIETGSVRLRVPVGRQARRDTWRRRLLPLRGMVGDAAQAAGLGRPAPESSSDRRWRLGRG